MEPKEAIATPPHSGAIEAYGIEPIPEALKTVRWPDLFLLVSNFLVNPGTILIGGLAVASGLSFWATILTSTLGILIAFSAYIVMATVGVDYGITGQVACRMVFGIQGAKWLPSIMRTIASAYWFAMQTIVGATVFVAIAHQWTGRHLFRSARGSYPGQRAGGPGAGRLPMAEADLPLQLFRSKLPASSIFSLYWPTARVRIIGLPRCSIFMRSTAGPTWWPRCG